MGTFNQVSKPIPVHSDVPLDLGRILAVYSPLALSWLVMAVEGPANMGMLGLAHGYEISAAAFTLVMGLSLFFESPVIDLLSTSTALGSSRQRWHALRRWALLMVGTSFCVHALVAFTPMFDLIVRDLMGVKAEIVEAARRAFQIMTPWSAIVGWRRYLSGMMIRHGVTKPISFGTGVRLLALCVVGFPMVLVFKTAGLMATSCAMVAAVAAETSFIHWVSRRVTSTLPDRPDEEIGMRELAKFHLPLTASTMVMMSSPVLVTRALAQSANQELTLSGWQTAGSLVWIFRSMTFALPESVISLYSPGAADRLLKKFCLVMGAGLTALMLGFHVSGMDGFWFARFYGADAPTVAVGRLAFLGLSLAPLLGGVMSYYRGVLTAHHVTVARLTAITASLVCLFGGLEAGLAFGWPGVLVGAFGMTVAQVAENGALAFSWWRRGRSGKDLALAGPRMEDPATINLNGEMPLVDPASAMVEGEKDPV